MQAWRRGLDMANRHAGRVLMLILFAMVGFYPSGLAHVHADASHNWWDDDWPYRVSVIGLEEGVAEISLNFSELFTELGLEGALLDLRSIRVVAYQDGVPAGLLPYEETYSTQLIDLESLNEDPYSTEPYWSGDGDTQLNLDLTNDKGRMNILHAQTTIDNGSPEFTGFAYHFNEPPGEDWSDYDILLYDVWPEVYGSAVDQTPDLFIFELGGLGNCSFQRINGPALAMGTWNATSTSLKPFGACITPDLSALNFLRFAYQVNRPDLTEGYYDPGDQVDLWLDEFRLVDQDGGGTIRWVSEADVDQYYIYFDTLNHEGHPLPDLITTEAPTLTAERGPVEAGGYFYNITGASTGDLEIWAAPTTEKVFQTNQAPAVAKPLLVHAARGEFEPVQLIVRSPETQSLSVSTSLLIHDNGIAAILPEQIEIFRVDYVLLNSISDQYGRPVLWPDPLYPITHAQPIEFLEGVNQPLWFRIHVPVTALPGHYSGEINVGSAIIPISLTVWDFALPKTLYLENLMGFDWDTVMAQYGGITGGVPHACYEDLEQAINATFEDYRLTPSDGDDNPLPLDVLLYSLTSYEVNQAQKQQLESGSRVWWQFSDIDDPPLVNPTVIDRPGLEPRILPWLAWVDRIDGFNYCQTADWDGDPWSIPFSNDLYNGDGYLFYPPKDTTLGFDPCNPASNRLVPSLRLEMLREGLEDYAYFWLLNRGQPRIGEGNPVDSMINALIHSRTAFSRIPTAFDPLRLEIARLIEAQQTHIYLPLLIR